MNAAVASARPKTAQAITCAPAALAGRCSGSTSGAMMHLGIGTHGEQILSVAMLLLFIVGFAMSAGPLVWVLCSEVQPLEGRDFGIGCSTFANMIVGATSRGS